MKKDAFYLLFIEDLNTAYNIENQLVESLPQLAEAVSIPELREAIQEHLTETKNQVARLDQIFKELNETPQNKQCQVLKALIQDADDIIKEHSPSAVRDAALINAAQRVEHFEMALYGALRTYANQLDLSDISDLLQKTLDEEGNANKLLSDIAEGGFFTAGVNQRAREEG